VDLSSRDLISQPVMFRAIELPARCAYLIGARSADGLRRAVAEASTRWGGVSEPIIPVRSNGKVDGFWQQLTKLTQVQCVVNVDLDLAVAQLAAEALALPLVELRHIDRSSPSIDSTFPLLVESGVVQQRLRAPFNAPLWQVVAAGCWTEELNVQLPEISRYADDIPWECPHPDLVGRAQLDRNTLIERTSAQFYPYRQQGGSPEPAVVWVTAANSFTDCLGFWNLRALRSALGDVDPMVLIPYKEVHHWVGFDEQFREVLRRPVHIEPDALVFSHGAPKQVEAVASLLGLVASKSTKISSSIGFPQPPKREPPFLYSGHVDPFMLVMFDREYGVVTQFVAHAHGGEAIARFDSSIKMIASGRHLLRLESAVFDGIPRRPTTARLIHENARWAGESLELSVSTGTSTHHLDLHLPNPSEVVDRLLCQSDGAATASDKGLLGQRLQQLGLVDHLSFEVMPTIRVLTTPRSKELVRELAALGADAPRAQLLDIASSWGGRAERRYRSISDLKSDVSRQAPLVAERLANAGWMERGFEVRCADCGVRSFVKLAETKSAAECPACSSIQKFTGPTGPEVHYRLNGLLDLASDQGVLVHLLAEAELRRRFDHVHLLPGVDVNARSRREEVDLFGICGGQVVVGEAKTSADQFTSSQLDRDVGLAAGLQADRVVLACAQVIPERVRSMAKLRATRAGLAIEFVDSDTSAG
jgi:hypothetical protein